LPDPVGDGERGGGFTKEREREPPELLMMVILFFLLLLRQWRGRGGPAACELPVEDGDDEEERECGGAGYQGRQKV